MQSCRVVTGGIERFCEHYHGQLFHAVLCDAPYEMSFMNSQWDGTGVSFDSETWKGIAKLLHPGGFLFVFAGTVNDDLISVAMRKAGLRKFHCLRGWVNGSGFPKATRVDTQIDRAAGASGKRPYKDIRNGPNTSMLSKGDKFSGGYDNNHLGGELPATPLAKTWEGHRYGLQAIKPSIETVLVFQKPYEGRAVDCITETGAGALWIDGARISPGEDVPAGGASWGLAAGVHEGWKRPAHQNYEPTPGHNKGRWPANFFLEHHSDCRQVGVKTVGSGERKRIVRSRKGFKISGSTNNVQKASAPDTYGLESISDWECVESCPVRRLGKQSRESKSSQTNGHDGRYNAGIYDNRENGYWGSRRADNSYNDQGTVGRFFFQSHWMHERLEQSDPLLYCAKATRKERDAGLDELPLKMRHRVNGGHGLEDDPKFAPVEARNIHPTVKAIALTKWLATLLLPPEEYAPRRLLVPFAGSGSEMIGALLAGWEEVVGVELSREYTDIARARIAWWQKWIEMGCTDVNAILQDGVKLEQERPEGQLSMFE